MHCILFKYEVDTVDSGGQRGRPRVWCEDAVPGMGLQQSLFAGF